MTSPCWCQQNNDVIRKVISSFDSFKVGLYSGKVSSSHYKYVRFYWGWDQKMTPDQIGLKYIWTQSWLNVVAILELGLMQSTKKCFALFNMSPGSCTIPNSDGEFMYILVSFRAADLVPYFLTTSQPVKMSTLISCNKIWTGITFLFLLESLTFHKVCTA